MFCALTVFERFILTCDLVIISILSLCILHWIILLTTLDLLFGLLTLDNSTVAAATPATPTPAIAAVRAGEDK